MKTKRTQHGFGPQWQELHEDHLDYIFASFLQKENKSTYQQTTQSKNTNRDRIETRDFTFQNGNKINKCSIVHI